MDVRSYGQLFFALLSKPSHIMTNPLRRLPLEVLQNVRDYASDRQNPHPTAVLIKNLAFIRDELAELSPFNDGYPSLWVSCLIPLPFCFRRYILADFMEPDRYMEDYRPPTFVDYKGNVRRRTIPHYRHLQPPPTFVDFNGGNVRRWTVSRYRHLQPL